MAKQEVPRPQVEQQLTRILASEAFSGSEVMRGAPRVKDLLRFLVEKKLNRQQLSDAIVTKEFFRKEPQTVERGQTIARTSAYHLRKRLRDYYATRGLNDLIEIALPLGTFTPDIRYSVRAPANTEIRLGLYHLNREAPDNVERAISHFNEAIRLANELPDGYAGKASALTTLTLHGLSTSPKDVFPEAEAAAKTALAIDASSWRAHAALGGVYMFQQKWELADNEIAAALKSDNLETSDHGVYGPYLLGTGRYDEATKLAKRYEDEYPDDPVFLRRAALYHYVLRQYEEAERILTTVLEMDRHLWHAHLLFAFIHLATERPDKALSCMHQTQSLTDMDLWPGLHALCAMRSGLKDEAEQRATRLISTGKGYIQPLQLALCSMALGKSQQAIKWLEQGANDGDPFMLWLHLWPLLDPLRGESPFQDLIRRMRLPSPPQ